MILFSILMIWAVGIFTGWTIRDARFERDAAELQRLRDEAWDLAHGISKGG